MVLEGRCLGNLLFVCVLAVLCPSFFSYEHGAENSLKIIVLERPRDCPQKSQLGDVLRVHFLGELRNGHVFEDSRKAKQPVSFKLGMGDVIKGWDHGLTGMCVGEVRKLTIPPHLAFGKEEVPGVPANSVVIYEVELLSIEQK